SVTQPGQANREQPGEAGVLFVLRDGQPVSVPVQFGISDGSRVQVVSGVSAGDQVVTGGGSSQKKSSSSGSSSGQASSRSSASNPLTPGGPVGGPPRAAR
ncbi:MAG: hypothetical protein KGJ86_02700, partial [Chloroflexota bacterium]|nr:hypothetical protein [Chloroflexota bacterium]